MIHKEGYKLISYTILLCLILNLILNYLPIPVWIKCTISSLSIVFFLIILQFFRNPQRTIPYDENAIICPADGKVVVIEEMFESEYLNEKRIQISVFMSPFNVHVNRYPVSGKIAYLKYHPGLFLVAWHPKSSTDNERTTVVIEKNNGVKILLRQIAGALAKRIVYYPKEGDVVKQGEELGFIKFGSRVDIFVPAGTKINVKLNQKVRGGETILAQLQ